MCVFPQIILAWRMPNCTHCRRKRRFPLSREGYQAQRRHNRVPAFVSSIFEPSHNNPITSSQFFSQCFVDGGSAGCQTDGVQIVKKRQVHLVTKTEHDHRLRCCSNGANEHTDAANKTPQFKRFITERFFWNNCQQNSQGKFATDVFFCQPAIKLIFFSGRINFGALPPPDAAHWVQMADQYFNLD